MEQAVERVVVIGTGQMGPGIAVASTLAGFPTTLVGRTAEGCRRGEDGYHAALGFLVDHAAVTPDTASAASAQLRLGIGMDTAADSDIVIESISESLPDKQELFRLLDGICPAGVILCTNTSGLRITDIARLVRRPERTVTTHFWNPGHLMPLVEVIQGERTSEDTVRRAVRFLEACGKKPVVGRRDVPGQICNRLLQAVIRESVYMVQEGIASAEDVESALKAGAGLRFPVYGPLEHLDLIGLDLALAVQSAVLPSLCSDTKPGALLVDLVRHGSLGVRTGRGFHDWSRRDAAEVRRRRDQWLVERMKEGWR
jgi:3-hydroxybutyryl-CoA dehydrogenase